MGLECRGGKVECLLLGKNEVCEETIINYRRSRY